MTKKKIQIIKNSHVSQFLNLTYSKYYALNLDINFAKNCFYIKKKTWPLYQKSKI